MTLNSLFALISIATFPMGHINRAQVISQNNVAFSFTATRLQNDKKQIEINGRLFNGNSDTLLKKKNIIVFDYLYVSSKKDSNTSSFIKKALESVKTIRNSNGY